MVPWRINKEYGGCTFYHFAQFRLFWMMDVFQKALKTWFPMVLVFVICRVVDLLIILVLPRSCLVVLFPPCFYIAAWRGLRFELLVHFHLAWRFRPCIKLKLTYICMYICMFVCIYVCWGLYIYIYMPFCFHLTT